MPVNATILALASFATDAATGISIPVRTGERGIGGERTASAKRAVLTIAREGATGTIAVLGADLQHPYAGSPKGNAYAASAVATSVRPQCDIVPGDGSTTAFTTNIDLLSGALAAAIAGTTVGGDAILVEMPAFRLAQDSTLAAITGTMTAAGVITTSAAFDTALKGGALAAGDTLLIGGVACTVTSASGSTINTDATVAVSSASPIYVTTRARRFQKVVAASAGAASNDVEATVVNSKLVLTFKVAPPAFDRAPTPSSQIPGAGAAIDPIVVHLVTVSEVKTAATYFPTERSGVRSRSVMWVSATRSGSNLSASKVYLEHAAD